jgi:hypothetical protein
VFGDQAVAQAEELSDIERDDTLVAVFGKGRMCQCRRLRFVRNDELDSVTTFGIAFLLNPDRLRDPALALLETEMREKSRWARGSRTRSCRQQLSMRATSPV